MSATTTPAEPTAGSTVVPSVRPVVLRAGLILLAAGALGIIGQILFFDVAAGVNLPLALGLLAVGGWLLRSARRPATIDIWLGPAAILFAAFAAIRADPFIVACDVLASYGGRSVVARPFAALIGLGIGTAGWVLGGAIAAVTDATRALPSGRTAARRAAPALPVLRGLLIALPLLVIFVVLFSSADAVFARRLEDLFGWELDL